ncbi:sensor histidine kinase [Fumia xinanensis]|uniref:histidine kinase n=1 Tax=Fumia xinanensis TaxID=2763659 RepID=A0A926DZZ4_9FIRM|nr:sensor histidine kinase [Fumia xinanensis]MBC8559039.1 histidine kinase [Fumia xinanensis]
MSRRKPMRLYLLLFQRVFIVSLAIILMACVVVVYLFSQYLLDDIGKTRVDLLRQIINTNQTVRNVTTVVTDDFHMAYAGGINDGKLPEEAVAAPLRDARVELQRFGMNSTIDVIWENGRNFSKEEQDPTLTHSFWFLSLLNGSSDRTWNMRFPEAEDADTFVLSYGRGLRDAEGDIVGAVICNTAHEMVYRNYSSLLREGNQIFILDENGIVVSHSNPALIGFTLYHMGSIESAVKKNDYSIRSLRGDLTIVSSYTNVQSGWTIVEELKVSNVVHFYRNIFLFGALTVLGGILLAAGISFLAARHITNPLTRLSQEMLEFGQDDNFAPMPVQNQYFEIQALSLSYNKMTRHILRLIENIKKQEAERRNLEFDFLQAQINPHFLHNTLLNIKSLVVMGKYDQSIKMLNAFLKLLKMPVTPDSDGHTLGEEIDHLRHYIDLMSFRYGNDFAFEIQAEEELLKGHLPQFILQPVVENAIFHGIADRDGDGKILVRALSTGGEIHIEVEDNGEGMSPDAVDKLWAPDDSRKYRFNHVGLRNVRSRIRYVFGEESDVEVLSEQGIGTTVRIKIGGKRGLSVFQRGESSPEREEQNYEDPNR